MLGAAVDCLGQRGVQSGSPNWETIGSARAVSAWLDPEHAVALTTIRPAGARGHDEEAVWGALLAPDPVRIDDPRLSTTWDAEGRQRGASLELWVGDEDPWAERAAGQVYCGSSMDLGALRLDCAFFTWRMDGHKGLGRYDVLRRT